MNERYGDVTVTIDEHRIAMVEIHRPPDNFFDIALIQSLADVYEALDDQDDCRAVVLCSEGKHFCAGADFTGRSSAIAVPTGREGAGRLYQEAGQLSRGQDAGGGCGARCCRGRGTGVGLLG